MSLRHLYRFMLVVAAGGLLFQETSGCATGETLETLAKFIILFALERGLGS